MFKGVKEYRPSDNQIVLVNSADNYNYDLSCLLVYGALKYNLIITIYRSVDNVCYVICGNNVKSIEALAKDLELTE